MIASKVSFSQDTLAQLNARPLNRAEKSRLREKRVKEYIRQLPSGTLIPVSELIAAAGYFGSEKAYRSGYQFIYGLKQRGTIVSSNNGTFKQEWTIPEDAQIINEVFPTSLLKQTVKTVKVAPEEADLQEVLEATGSGTHTVPAGVDTPTTKALTPQGNLSVVEMARHFAWEYNSDSLREFIRHLQSLEISQTLDNSFKNSGDSDEV